MNYKSKTNYGKHTWLPLEVIKQAIAENWLESLGYFVRLKSFHHRPVFYNYSLRKLSAYLKCSPATISHHIDILSQKGLCERIGANLYLKSNNKLNTQAGKFVAIGIDLDKVKQRALLRYAIIKENLQKQFRTFVKKSKALRFHNQQVKGIHDLKACKKAAYYYDDPKKLENSMVSVLTLSNTKFGFACNRSKSTGIKIQSVLNTLGLIKSEKRVKLVSTTPIDKRGFYELYGNGSFFRSNKGFVYERLSNAISM